MFLFLFDASDLHVFRPGCVALTKTRPPRGHLLLESCLLPPPPCPVRCSEVPDPAGWAEPTRC